MVISNIKQGPTQSVIPFGTFSGSSSAAVTSVISNDKPPSETGAIQKTPKVLINNVANGLSALKSTSKSSEKATVLKTPKLLIDNVANGQSALKPAKKTSKPTEPKTSNQFRPSPKPEFDHASKSPAPKSSFDFSLLRGAGVGSETPYARRLPCVYEPEKPLPPIFSIFD